MHQPVTFMAKSNQLLVGVLTGMNAKCLMVNFQVAHRAAVLASPRISAQHLLPQIAVQVAGKA